MHPGAVAPAKTVACRSERSEITRAWRLTLLGAIAALLSLEFGLSFLVAGWHYPKTPIREIREYTEGISRSHFSPDGFGTYGARLTGNPVLPNAPTVLVLGDSHVVQEAVADTQTFGAVIEGLSRSQVKPVNVRQYGWYDAAAPTYIANAPELLRQIHPQIVVVLLNVTDFTREALDEGWYWLMKIHPDFTIDLVDVRPQEPHGRLGELREFLGRSHLMLALRRRSVLLFGDDSQAADRPKETFSRQAEIPMIARASIKGLKAAYGDRLLVGYLPICTETCSSAPDRYERIMFSACQTEGSHCFSTRPAMSADMQMHHRILRGFHNTAPGIDHLNAEGILVAATAIWQEVQKQLPN